MKKLKIASCQIHLLDKSTIKFKGNIVDATGEVILKIGKSKNRKKIYFESIIFGNFDIKFIDSKFKIDGILKFPYLKEPLGNLLIDYKNIDSLLNIFANFGLVKKIKMILSLLEPKGKISYTSDGEVGFLNEISIQNIKEKMNGV
jgi:hypothetical protein